jgi:hypothetical protein
LLNIEKARVVGQDIGLMVAYTYATQLPAETEKSKRHSRPRFRHRVLPANANPGAGCRGLSPVSHPDAGLNIACRAG